LITFTAKPVSNSEEKTEMTRFFALTFLTAAVTFFAACNQGTSTNTARNSANAPVNTGANTAGPAGQEPANSTARGSKETNAGNDSNETSDFLTEAAQGGIAEVELGKMAVTKAASPDVKKFAQMMVDDHTKANTELKELAQKKGIQVPAETDSSHKSTMEDLRNLVGADFDKEYVEDMYDDHKHDVAEFEEQSENAADPDVKAFAAKTLPVLRKHLEAIEAIRSKMK
jgi:putative membrane protein